MNQKEVNNKIYLWLNKIKKIDESQYSTEGLLDTQIKLAKDLGLKIIGSYTVAVNENFYKD